jgi:hypothetical protein
MVLVRTRVVLGVEYKDAGSMTGRLLWLEELRVGVVCVEVSGPGVDVLEPIGVPEANDKMPNDVDGITIALPVSVLILSGGSSEGPKNGFRAYGRSFRNFKVGCAVYLRFTPGSSADTTTDTSLRTSGLRIRRTSRCGAG